MEQPKHIDKQTPDGAALNLNALYQIAPSCFTEARGDGGELRRVVDFEKLRLLLGDNAVEGAPEVYDFTWVGKRAALHEAAAPINKTLRPCSEESVDWDTTQNLYIEGDNLEVLKLLQNSYMGKVKMIYIDPPYNTGNDFVYHDDFARSAEEYDEYNRNEEGERFRKNTDSNGRFHSDWCSMMYARLMVARSLLKEDGVIFISIDDNEVENLKKICDEVFGSANFLNQFVWINKPEGRQISGAGAAGTHEYVLLYAKEQTKLTEFNMSAEWLKGLMPSSYKGYNFDVKKDDRGNYIATHELYNGNSKFNEETRPTLVFDIYYRETDNDIIIEEVSNTHLHKGYTKIVPHPCTDGIHKYHAYRWSREKILKEKYNLEFVKSGDTFKIYSKRRNFDLTTVRDIITDIITNNGSKDLEALNIKGFSYPKPVALMKLFANMLTSRISEDCDEDYPALSEKDIFLDFFSGSCSTAHAVMQLNAEDGGNRKFIMVQLPEKTDEKSEAHKAGYKNISELGKERIRRAGKKIKEESPLTTQDLDTGFRVFKCESSNYKDVVFAPKDYSQETLDLFVDNIKDDRTDLDLLFDCMLRWGVELSLPLSKTKVDGCTIHNVNDGDLVACFSSTVTENVIDSIAELSPLRVVFRDSSFEEAAQKMNLFELFKQRCGWTDEEVRNNVRVI